MECSACKRCSHDLASEAYSHRSASKHQIVCFYHPLLFLGVMLCFEFGVGRSAGGVKLNHRMGDWGSILESVISRALSRGLRAVVSV